MYFIYIIYSEKLNRYYVGTTDNVQKKLSEHNSGFYSESFTFKGMPWILKLSFECRSSEKAYQLEKFIKKMKSKIFIKRIIDNSEILNDIQDKL